MNWVAVRGMNSHHEADVARLRQIGQFARTQLIGGERNHRALAAIGDLDLTTVRIPNGAGISHPTRVARSGIQPKRAARWTRWGTHRAADSAGKPRSRAPAGWVWPTTSARAWELDRPLESWVFESPAFPSWVLASWVFELQAREFPARAAPGFGAPDGSARRRLAEEDGWSRG